MANKIRKEEKRTISYLTTKLYVLLGVNDNLLLSVNRYDLSGAIRIARVVDKPTLEAKINIRSSRRMKATYPRFPFFVASTTRSSSIRKR